MNWLAKLLEFLQSLLAPPVTPQEPVRPPQEEPVSFPSTYTAKITAVYSGLKADIHADTMSHITILRKQTLYINLTTDVMETLSLGLELGGTAVELNEKHHNAIYLQTAREHSGKINAYQFPWPEPNGYPITSCQAAAFIIRDPQGKTVDRHPFTLTVRGPDT